MMLLTNSVDVLGLYKFGLLEVDSLDVNRAIVGEDSAHPLAPPEKNETMDSTIRPLDH